MEDSAPVAADKRSVIEPNGELVLGLVAPLGTDLGKVEAVIRLRLERYAYQPRTVKLSSLLEWFELDTSPRGTTIAEAMHHKMDQGNALRLAAARPDALALAAIRQIRKERGSPDHVGGEPRPRWAFILNQLKRPEEVATLREVYGGGFFLLGVSASSKTRKQHLREGRGIESEDEADALIRRDEDEELEHGQQVRRTFHLADAFISLDEPHEFPLRRFVDLMFGDPFHSPTRHEHTMFMAFSASLRSADLSRQVGAVIANDAGDLLGSGANDVPSAGGGQYWPDEEPSLDDDARTDHRDWALGYDSNVKHRDRILLEIARAAGLVDGDTPDNDALVVAREKLKKTTLFDLTEFGRAVHAEMAAISSCARVGVSCKNGVLFCTTFPCHNCTKHIVAAGIKEVVYIEPYPKSKALALHSDSVELADSALRCDCDPGRRVLFRPFVGIAPRRFMDLFSMSHGAGRGLRRKDSTTGDVVRFERGKASPRVHMPATSYLELELKALRFLDLIASDADGGPNDAEKEQEH